MYCYQANLLYILIEILPLNDSREAAFSIKNLPNIFINIILVNSGTYLYNHFTSVSINLLNQNTTSLIFQFYNI